MNRDQYTVLVIPSCNEPGLEVIESLRFNNKFRIIGASSIDVHCDPSVEIVDEHISVPWLTDSEFESRFYDILDRYHVDLVFPTTDAFVQFLSHRQHTHARFVTPPASTADVAVSKKATYSTLEGYVRVPALYSQWPVPLPAFAKPDRGSGGRGVLVVDSELAFRLALERGLLVMEYLPGTEITVDCLSGLDSELLFCNPRVRARVERGIAVATWPLEDAEILRAVHVISKVLPMRGPWFAQFKYDCSGSPCLLEVNARVAGSMGLTRLQGVNIPLITAFMLLGYPVEIPKPMKGIRLKRRLRNIASVGSFKAVIWDLDDTLVMSDGQLSAMGVTALTILRTRGKIQLLLTKNPNAESILAKHQITYCFDDVCVSADKLAGFKFLLQKHNLEAADCVMVNDSNMEKLEFQRLYPEIRWLTPDAVELLIGRP